MERLNPIILDACTIINIIFIDEDETIFKKILNLPIILPEKVLSEVRVNYKKKLSRLKSRIGTSETKYIDIFEQRIGKLIQFQKGNLEIKAELGDRFELIKQYVSYSKANENGELYSTALAQWLSRSEKMPHIFYTDDLKAKYQFATYFDYQQLGFICDSIDFLIYLFVYHASFPSSKAVEYLTKLGNEYAFEISLLIKALQAEQNRLAGNKKEGQIRVLLSQLIEKLQTKELKHIASYRERIQVLRRTTTFNMQIFEEFQEVFDESVGENDLLSKLNSTVINFRKCPIHN